MEQLHVADEISVVRRYRRRLEEPASESECRFIFFQVDPTIRSLSPTTCPNLTQTCTHTILQYYRRCSSRWSLLYSPKFLYIRRTAPRGYQFPLNPVPIPLMLLSLLLDDREYLLSL